MPKKKKVEEAAEEEGQTTDAGPAMLGHFKVLDKIGQGGMAVVYKGIQPSLNRPVAIKVLPEQFAKSPELLGRFEREATIVAQLNHSNIVQVIDRGRQDDTLYIIMEYVDGESIEDLIRQKRLTLPRIVQYGMQICDALEYAHGQGVVHRDLKPSNILIDGRSDRAKIADFGIAAIETTTGAMATLTMHNASLGTMNYMSPEQRIDAHKVTYLTDVFSFGVILYEMLVGQIPVGHFKLPSFIRRDVPIGFDAIVKKCLETNPVDRYQNAKAIRDDLARLGAHTAVRLPSLKSLAARIPHPKEFKVPMPSLKGLVARLNGVSRRRKILLAASGTVAAVLLLAVLIGVNRGGGPGGDAEPGASGAGAAGGAVTGAAPNARLQADFSRAQEFIHQGSPESAINIFKDIVRSESAGALAAEAQYQMAVTLHDMDKKEEAKMEYERLIRSYPEASRVPEAALGKCRTEWETAPRLGLLRNLRDADLQQRLVDELNGLVAEHPEGPHVPEALRLVVTVAEPGNLWGWQQAATALERLYKLSPSEEKESLYRAAELYDKKSVDADKTISLYESFLAAFPDDERRDAILARTEEWRNKAAAAESPKDN